MPSQFSGTNRSLFNDTSRTAFIAWGVGTVLLSAWSLWFFGSEVTVYQVSTRAHLEVKQAPHPVAALVAGKIISAAVVLGQEVRTNDVLVELDASAERLRLAEEQARLQTLLPRRALLKQEIAALQRSRSSDRDAALASVEVGRFRYREMRTAAEFAAENARRLKEESSAGSVAQIDALRAQAEAGKLSASGSALSSEVRRLENDARARKHQSEARIDALKQSAASLDGEIASAGVAVQRHLQDIEKYRIRAPVAGRIGETLPLRPGSYVTPGQQVATVVPGGDLMIVAEFAPAAVLGRIHAGQRARMRLDGFPWAQYGSIDATVSRVATEVRDNLVRVEFMPRLPQADHILMQHGLPGSIEVSLESASPAVLLLRTSGQMLATAAPPARAEPKPVTGP